MTIVVVQIGPKKFIVGRSIRPDCPISGYRALCECTSEGVANEIGQALVKVDAAERK